MLWDDLTSPASARVPNVIASELETALAQHKDVRAGCCALVACPAPAGEKLIVLAELQHGAGDVAGVARALAAGAARAGIRADEVQLLRRGTLPKTPSGKLQRHRCRSLAINPGAAVLAGGRVTLKR